MIFPILFAAMALIIGTKINAGQRHNKYTEFCDYVIGGLLTIVIAVFVMILGIGLAMVIGMAQPPGNWTTVSQTPLRSVTNYNGVTGTFFLFGGVIDSKTQYTYWYPEGGGLRQATVDHNVKVFEEDRQDGVLLENHQTCRDGDFSLLWICNIDNTGYDFHVPQGTVTTQFSLK